MLDFTVLGKLFIQPLRCLNIEFFSNNDGMPEGKIYLKAESIGDTFLPGTVCRASTAVTNCMSGNTALGRLATFFGMTALTRYSGYTEVIGIQTLLKAAANKIHGRVYQGNHNRDMSDCVLSRGNYYQLVRALALNCIKNARRTKHSKFLDNCVVIAAPSSSNAPGDIRNEVAKQLKQPAIPNAMNKIMVAEAKRIVRSKAGRKFIRNQNKVRSTDEMLALVRARWSTTGRPVDGSNRIPELRNQSEAYYARLLSWATQETSATQMAEDAKTMFSPRRIRFWKFKSRRGKMVEDRQVDPNARAVLKLPSSRPSAHFKQVIKATIAKDGYINILVCEDDLVTGATQNEICRIIQKVAKDRARIIFFVGTDARLKSAQEVTEVLSSLARMNILRSRCMALRKGESFKYKYPKNLMSIYQFLANLRFKYKIPIHCDYFVTDQNYTIEHRVD